ncbi:glycosyltransferase family 1 protein [Ideonella sp. A 288]|uniref:glycosyltransferase family 4 protein n=1 Tax=Ideonella sp. A 288 TaxID=1962181 RepID=UPI000B4BD936|nr:glycosyltransferase family 1 protein [Ideonella sp. A 288]
MADEKPARPDVVINGRFLTQPVTGVQRYAREVLRAMDAELARGDRSLPTLGLLAPAGTNLPPLAHIQARCVGRLRGHLWEQLELPWHSRGQLLWGLASTGPIAKARQSITVHDAAVVRMPQTYSPAFRAWYRLVLARLGPRLPIIMSVSRFSAAEATACFGVPAQRTRVTLEGWQQNERLVPDPSVLVRHGLLNRPYILAVSSPTPNKNFQAIVDALTLLGEAAPVCVAVGAADPGVFRGATLSLSLRHVGRVSDAQLLALYRHARCFVFPSFYEGFGLPPLEAMAQGCPVLASTAEAVREVCGDAARYFAPDRPAELAALLGSVLADASLGASMSTAGLQRAAGFSWRAAARVHLDAMRELLPQAAPHLAHHSGITLAQDKSP